MWLLDSSGQWVPGISTKLNWKIEKCSAEYGSFFPSLVFDKMTIFKNFISNCIYCHLSPILLDILKNVPSQHVLNGGGHVSPDEPL